MVSPMRIIAALATALLIALGMASPAAAHDYIISSTPADGAVLAEAPARIEIEFSADIIEASPAFLMLDAAGSVVWEATPELNGRVATAPFPDIPAGAYSLNWSLVSSDGHRLEGAIPFTLGDAAGTPIATEPNPEPNPETEPTLVIATSPPAAEITPSDGSATTGENLTAIYLGLGGLAAASIVVLLLRKRSGGL